MTITTLRPNADSHKPGISFSSGTTIFSLIDDSPVDDNTYVYVANNIQTPQASFIIHTPDTISVSASQRVKAVRFRVRIRMHSTASGVSATLKLANRNPNTGVLDFWESFSTAGTAVIEKTGVWRTKPPPDSLKRWSTEWTEFAVDAVQVNALWYYAWNVKVNLRLTELYFDVDVRDRPTISPAPTVTGHTSSTRPTVAWVYVPNADSDPQVAHRVKVFSAAQYGAAGFSPDTSTATWDSGILPGAADSLTVGTALVNGVTYKMYVAGAQDFNGSYWFSDWGVSSAFTITLTPPPVPTITVAADTTVPRGMRNSITVQSHLNLLTADDASADTTVGTWVNQANATVVRDTTPTPNYGAGLIKMTATSAATMEARTATGVNGVKVKAGQLYTMLAAFRTAVTARSCAVGIGWYDRAGTIIGSVAYGGNVTDAVGNWAAVASHTATAPSNAVTAAVFLKVTSPASSEVHYADTVLLGTSTVASGWSPGGTVGTASTVIERNWATTGIRNLAHPQLWSGGDETGTADGFHTSGAGSRVVYDTQHRHLGGGCVRWDCNTTTSKLYFGWPSAAEENPAPLYAMAAVPGQVYTFAVYAKSTASFSTVLNLQALDKGGNAVGSPVASSGITLTTSFVLYQVSITVPAGGVWVRAHFDNTASVTERFVWVDSVQWVAGSTVDTVPGRGTGQAAVWRAVRGADEAELILPADPGDLVTVVHDLEVPPGYIVTYRASNVLPATTSAPEMTSAVSAYVQTVLTAPGPGIWILRDPAKSMNSVRLRVVGIPQESQKEEAQVYYPARPDDVNGIGQRPVVLSDYIGGYDGQLSVLCDSEEEWLQLCDVIGAKRVLWLVYPNHGGRHIRLPGDRSWSRISERTGNGSDSVWRRPITLDYVETDADG